MKLSQSHRDSTATTNMYSDSAIHNCDTYTTPTYTNLEHLGAFLPAQWNASYEPFSRPPAPEAPLPSTPF